MRIEVFLGSAIAAFVSSTKQIILLERRVDTKRTGKSLRNDYSGVVRIDSMTLSRALIAIGRSERVLSLAEPGDNMLRIIPVSYSC